MGDFNHSLTFDICQNSVVHFITSIICMYLLPQKSMSRKCLNFVSLNAKFHGTEGLDSAWWLSFLYSYMTASSSFLHKAENMWLLVIPTLAL